MPEILHRTREINELELIAKPTNSQLNQIFFIYGLASTGKSISVKSVFSPKTASYASCIECFYPKLLFETLLSGFNLDIKCDSIDTFFSSISTLENKQYFLIIDDAHCLLKMNLGCLVPALSKIRESTRINITVILISSLTFDHFLEYCPTIPYSIHFKTYSENEILDILALSKPSNVDHTFYRTFVNIIYQNFKLAINDVKEYLYFCQVLFPIYCEPIKTGKALNTETGKLYKLIDKVLKDNIEKILLHQQFHVGKSKVTSQLSFDLPFCTKFLLIAGFLASFNPSKLDKRYFTKTGETLGKKGGIKRAIRKEKISSSLLGPKAFPVERMIAIYHAIFTQKIQESNDISIQIATLINLGLITRVGNDPLNSVKCKCNVGMSAIKSIANKIGFQLDNYLHY